MLYQQPIHLFDKHKQRVRVINQFLKFHRVQLLGPHPPLGVVIERPITGVLSGLTHVADDESLTVTVMGPHDPEPPGPATLNI